MTLRERLQSLFKSRAGRRAARVALDPDVRERLRDSTDAIRTALTDGKLDAEEVAAIAGELGELRDAMRAAYQRAGGVS